MNLSKKLKPSTENKDLDILPNYLFGVVLTSKLGKVLGIKYPAMFCEFWDNSNRWANDIEAANKNAKKILARLRQDKKFAVRIIEQCYIAEKKLNKISSKIKLSTLDQAANKRLADLFKIFIALYMEVMIYHWLPIACEGFSGEFSNFLKKFLSSEFGRDQALVNKYFVYLTTTKKPSKRQLAEREIINFLKKYQSVKRKITVSNELTEFIAKFLRKYGWLNYNYQGPALTKKDVLAKIKESQHQTISEKKEQLNVDFIKSNREYFRLFELARELMYLKNRSQETFFYAHFCLNNLLSAISRRLRLTLKETKSMTAEEILVSLKENKADKDKLSQRSRHAVFVFQKNKLDIIAGEKAIRKFLDSNLAEAEIKAVKEITGQVAYAAKAVRGRVKIINTISDIKKLNQGDILVSSKTNPNFMVAIKKAVAIITDYGGITCHAAIVSRELKIPCVIGTKIATRVLKDGDLVEVDAERGMVRLIS